MRLRAGIGGLLLALSACAHLPERVRIDVDGRSVELRRQSLSALTQPGWWSTSRDCAAEAPRVDPAEAGKIVVLVKPDQLQVTGKDGTVWSLYRCLP